MCSYCYTNHYVYSVSQVFIRWNVYLFLTLSASFSHLVSLWDHVSTVPDRYRSGPENVADRPSVSIATIWAGPICVSDRSWAAPLLKVIRIVSDRFLGRCDSSGNTVFASVAVICTKTSKMADKVAVLTTLKTLENVSASLAGLNVVISTFFITDPVRNLHGGNKSDPLRYELCFHCTRSLFAPARKAIWYSGNMVWMLAHCVMCN